MGKYYLNGNLIKLKLLEFAEKDEGRVRREGGRTEEKLDRKSGQYLVVLYWDNDVSVKCATQE